MGRLFLLDGLGMLKIDGFGWLLTMGLPTYMLLQIVKIDGFGVVVNYEQVG